MLCFQNILNFIFGGPPKSNSPLEKYGSWIESVFKLLKFLIHGLLGELPLPTLGTLFPRKMYVPAWLCEGCEGDLQLAMAPSGLVMYRVQRATRSGTY